MKLKWEIDDATVVEAEFSGFGKEIVRVNGADVINQRSMRTKGELAFALSGDRRATIKVGVQMGLTPAVELRIDDRLYVPTTKDVVRCPACNVTVRPNDRFCDGCGKALPAAEVRTQHKHVQEATGAMRALAILFAVFGLIMFFVSRSQNATALTQLATLSPDMMLPIEGVPHKVAELQAQVRWEPWGLLITNWVLAAVMAGLALWGKRSPLPAVLVATATYAVVIVVNAISDPKTIAQGLLLKIVIIGFFIKGIKAALALRAAAE